MKRKFLVPFVLACALLSSCSSDLVSSKSNSNGTSYEDYTLTLAPTAALYVGQKQDLSVVITGASAAIASEVTWKNSDPSVVSLTGTGSTVTLYGVSSGTSVVTALVGNRASASCVVSVLTQGGSGGGSGGGGGGGSQTIVTSIILSETNKTFSLVDGGPRSFTLNAQVTTNNGMTVNPSWSSTVMDVATVSGSGNSATVTVNKAGETNIVVSAGTITAACALHVIDASQPDFIHVDISRPDATLEIGDETQLGATVTGTSTTQTWQSSNAAVATVDDNGLVTAHSSGTAVVTITVTNAEGKTSSAQCTISVLAQGGDSEYEQKIALWSIPGHIYFHYFRPNSDYANWAVWAWQSKPRSLEGSLWGANPEIQNLAGVIPQTYGFLTNKDAGKTGVDQDEVYMDEHGIVIPVDISLEELPGGKTGVDSPLVSWDLWEKKSATMGFFIVDQTKMTGKTNWVSDGGGEIYIKDLKKLMPEGKNSFLHVFCVQGNVSGYSTSSITQTFVNPTISDKTGKYVSVDDTTLLEKDEYKKGIATSTTFLDDRPGVGYQIFVPAFADSDGDGMGDLRGIINKLDYLENLGVKVLWLTPIQESNSYHGYDVTDYYRIDSKFGTIEDYQELLYDAHHRGMKVLMDMVINHTSKSNVLFQKSEAAVVEKVNGKEINYRDMYIWKYKGDKVRVWDGNITYEGDQKAADQSKNFTTATIGGSDPIDAKLNELWFKDGESDYYYYGKFGSGMAELNYNSQATRDYMTDMCKYWLSFGLDGFRLDATKHIYLLGELNTNLNLSNHDIVYDVGFRHYWNEEMQKYIDADNDYSYDRTLNVNFWKQFAGSLKSAYPNCFLVGENFDGWDARMAPFYASMDSQFDFQTYFNLNQFYESSIGYKLQSTINTYKAYRPNGLINGSFTSNHDIYRLINHAAQHDDDIPKGVNGDNHKEVHSQKEVEQGHATQAQVNDTYAKNMAKYYAAVTILNPGVSWIYYGDELGMSGNLKDLVPDEKGKVYDDHGNNVDRWYRQPMRWGKVKGEGEVTNFSFGGIEIQWDYYNQNLATASEQANDSNSMLNYFKAICAVKNHEKYPTYGYVTNYGSISGQEKGECYLEFTDGARTVCVCINNTDSAKSYQKMGWTVIGSFGNGASATNIPAHGFVAYAK